MREEDYSAHLLLRPLADDQPGPSKISVVKAMRDGRRRRSRRWWAGGSAVVAAVATASAGGVLATQRPPRPVLPPDPPLPAACAVGQLPIGEHHSAEQPAGEPSGTWLAAATEPPTDASVPGGRDASGRRPDAKNSLLVWRDGVLVADVPAPGVSFSVSGVNSSGAVAGNAKMTTPYVYRDGAFHKLAGGAGRAAAINDAGAVAGMLGATGPDQRPVRWPSAGADPVTLPVPAGAIPDLVTVTGIAEDGSVIGAIANFGYLWSPDGTGRYLTAPPEGDGTRSAAPRVDASPPLGTAFTPMVFRNGWIYGSRGALSYSTLRYHPETGTWQRLSDQWMGPQLGDRYPLGDPDPRVLVGRAVLDLPLPSGGRPGRDRYFASTVSDDASVIAGKVEGAPGDTSTPTQPIIWRCR
ncbi:hypothetical protein ACFY36_23370 [Actinoplanes sp. NPDC000266]